LVNGGANADRCYGYSATIGGGADTFLNCETIVP
jgi:hypothetical protein